VATYCPVLDVSLEALAREVASGVHYFARRKDLNAEVIDRAGNFAILKEDQLERRLGNGEVRVAGTNLRWLSFKELGVELDGLFEIRHIEGELQSGHLGLLTLTLVNWKSNRHIDACQ